ncbi:hypothetical protein E2C01_020015 [Portunus trituberculatus]|uniref:Uncharacterized protein n=1 Tax=Portunus trituberculatus TaxID=210409 RepID=A0A5B7E201_PORTR|nr:hypothetical protein [Portunus trituberculatus]
MRPTHQAIRHTHEHTGKNRKKNKNHGNLGSSAELLVNKPHPADVRGAFSWRTEIEAYRVLLPHCETSSAASCRSLRIPILSPRTPQHSAQTRHAVCLPGREQPLDTTQSAASQHPRDGALWLPTW